MFHPAPPGGSYYYHNSPYGPQLRQPFPPHQPMFRGPSGQFPGLRTTGLTIVEVESSELADPARRLSSVPSGNHQPIPGNPPFLRHNPDPGTSMTSSMSESSDSGDQVNTTSSSDRNIRKKGKLPSLKHCDVRKSAGGQQSHTESEMGDIYSSEESAPSIAATKTRSWKEVNEDVSARMRAAATDSPPVLPKRQSNQSTTTTASTAKESRFSSNGSVLQTVNSTAGDQSGAISTSSDEDDGPRTESRVDRNSHRRQSSDRVSSATGVPHSNQPSNMSISYDNEHMSMRDGVGSEFMAPSQMHDEDEGVEGRAMVPFGSMHPQFGRGGGYPPPFPPFGHPDQGFPIFPPPNSEGLPPFMPGPGGMMPPPGFHPAQPFRGPFPPPPNMGPRPPPPEMMGPRPPFLPGGPRPPNDMELRMHHDPGVLFTPNGPIIPSNRSVSSDRSRSKKSNKNSKHSKKQQQMMKKRSQSMEFLIPNGNGGMTSFPPPHFGNMPPPHMMNGGPPPPQFQGGNDPNMPPFGQRGPMMGGPPPGAMFGGPGMMPQFGGPPGYPNMGSPGSGMMMYDQLQQQNGMGMGMNGDEGGYGYGYYNGPSIEEVGGGGYGNSVMIIGEAPPNAVKTSEILKTGALGGTLEQQQQEQQMAQSQQGMMNSTSVNLGGNFNGNAANNGSYPGVKGDNSLLTEGDANKLKEKMMNEEIRDREMKKGVKKRGACYRVCCESGLTTVIWVVIAIMLIGLILGLVLGLTLV